MPFMLADDAISGKEARAYATINGNVEEMFYIKKLEAKIEKNKAEMKVLGTRKTQYKASGWKGSGTLTIYYATSLFRQIMLDYIKTGRDTNFDIQMVNEDPTSAIGKQTVILKGVNLDSVVIAKGDADADLLDEEVPFTFEDADILDSFGQLVLG